MEHNKENEAHAKEEASNWKDEEKAKQIIELFESGYHLAEIRNSVFPNWGQGLKKDDKLFRKHTIDYIVLRALECEDWDEYARKQTKLRNQRKKQKLAR